MLPPAVPEGTDLTTPKPTSGLARVARYAAVKLLSLMVTVAVGLCLYNLQIEEGIAGI